MPDPSGADTSGSYFARLLAVVLMSGAQLVRRPSHTKRAEAARRLARHGLLAAVVAGTLITVLMIWFDVWEITLMPPRGTAGLWPFRVLTDFGKDTHVLSLLVVLLLGVTLVAPATHE